MRLSGALLDRIDLEAAIAQAAPPRGEFFPSRLEPLAAQQDPGAYAGWLRAQLLIGTNDHPPETVWVPRRGPGSRPVPDMSFAERTVMEALVGLLAEQLGEDRDRLGLRALAETSDGERERFERLPVEADVEYVVLADVASFYEYVDHSYLVQEIVELTGDTELATALQGFLQKLMSRDFGLPQGPRASDVLADLYLSSIDRELRRSGIPAWRFNDDFLMGAEDDRSAILLLLRLEASLRTRGLALNNAKNRVVPLTTYEGWLSALSDLLTDRLVEDLGGPFYGFDPESFGEADIDALSVDSIEEVFSEALDSEEKDPYNLNDRLIPQALHVLAAAESLVPLERLTDLATEWSAHARTVSLYLRSFIDTEHETRMVKDVAKLLRAGGDLVPWVRGWLLDALARSDQRIRNNGASSAIRSWLKSGSEPWFVRGRCALVMAQRGRILEQAEYTRIFDEAPIGTRGDLTAAVALAAPDWADAWLETLGSDTPLLLSISELMADIDVASAL